MDVTMLISFAICGDICDILELGEVPKNRVKEWHRLRQGLH